MTNLVNWLSQRGEILSDLSALEFFARDGSWHTLDYFQAVGSITLWEISPEFEMGLRQNFSEAEVAIGDSFKLARIPSNQNRWNFIVFDNPQNCFGPKGNFCEHFEALAEVPFLADRNKASLVVFNVNSNPFNFDSFPKWRARRDSFYQVKDSGHLSLDFLANFYVSFFGEMGFHVEFLETFDRDPSYLHYFVVKLHPSSAL